MNNHEFKKNYDKWQTILMLAFSPWIIYFTFK